MGTENEWLELARTFHSFVDCHGDADVKPWELDAWAVEHTEPYDGVREMCQFLLHTWNSGPGSWKCGEFNLRQAWCSWDGDHQGSFQDWAMSPRFF